MASAGCGGEVASDGDGQPGGGGGGGPNQGSNPSEPIGPSTLSPGDCHGALGKPTLLFTPFAAPTQSYPTPNSLVVSADHVYAALRGPQSGPNVGPLSVYVGATSGGDFSTFATIEPSPVNFESGPVLGAHHVYWWVQPGSEDFVYPSHLAYRDAGGTVRDVPETEVQWGAATAIDGDDAFALTCADDDTLETNCAKPGSHFTLFSTRLDTGVKSWSRDLAPTDAVTRGSLAVDATWVSWTARPATSDATTPARLLRAARDGSGDVQEVPIGLAPGEWIAQIVTDGDALDAFILATGSGVRELDLVRVTDDGTVSPRVRLPDSAAPPHVALDDASIYVTVDDAQGWPNTARTLVRVCRDGSNPTPLVTGLADGTATDISIMDLAVDGRGVYFTSANEVYAIAK